MASVKFSHSILNGSWSVICASLFIINSPCPLCSDGFFFAVKEVSLLDQGSQGKQSVYYLEQVRRVFILIWCNVLVLSIDILWNSENLGKFLGLKSILFLFWWDSYFFHPVIPFQEISLLSQFEHENIVQYYGTDKVLFFPCSESWI